MPIESETAKGARIFLSYKRNSDVDEKLALQVYEELSRDHEVFIDQKSIALGASWTERIESELRRADFLIPLLSAQSVNSEMVYGEISRAHQLCKEQGRPAILPIRVAYGEPLRYPLNVYLDRLNWAYWKSEADTPRLIGELLRAVSGGRLGGGARIPDVAPPAAAEPWPQPLPAAQPPAALEQPEGTMDVESGFYIERANDGVALETIRQSGVTITIKGPRQMGKSSLLIRVAAAAAAAGKHVAYLDFQLIDRDALSDAALFFRQFCSWLTDALEMEDRVEQYWSVPLGNSQRCTRYLSRYILPGLSGPLVLAMDEVDSIFETEFRSDFFSMLRSWHNNRATSPAWKRLDLTLVTSTEPYQLIKNLNQSPFNVGQVIELTDFAPEQVSELNRRHSCPLSDAEETQLMALLGGHPYLVRRALYLLASGRISAADLFTRAADDFGPFGDHLRYHLFRLHGKDELISGLRRVLRTHTCPDELVFFRLRGAGLVRREGRAVLPRCQLYADYFGEHVNG